jgi:hypothetical protein
MRGTFLVLVTVAMLGCAGDDGPVFVIPDAAPIEVDAMIPCQAATTYMPGTIGADVQEATDYPAEGTPPDGSPHQIYFVANLTDTDPVDVLYIELYAGFGAFASGDIANGVYPLTDDDAAYSTCGACVTLGAKVSDAGPAAYYSARGGVLNLSSVSGRLTGTLQNVTLYRVTTDVEGNPTDQATLDCTSKITSASFDAELMAPPP